MRMNECNYLLIIVGILPDKMIKREVIDRIQSD